jgi:hypothetical protein
MPIMYAAAAAEALTFAETLAAAEALAAQQAAAATAAEVGAITSAEAGIAQAAQAAQAAQTANTGIMGAQGVGTTGTGIVADVAPAVEAATAVGGQGAGTAGVQQAMQSATQAAGSAPGSITAAPQAAGSTVGTTANANTPLLNEYGEAYTLNNSAPATRGIGAAPASAPANVAYSPLQLPPNVTPTGAESAAGYTAEGATAFDKFSAFADKHPFMTGAAMYTGAYNLGLLDQKEMEMPAKKSYGNQYTMSKDFKASEATPNVYQPTYQTYAEGGVMTVGSPSSEIPEPRKVLSPMSTASTMAEGGMPGYAKGGSLSSSLDFYKQMAEGQSGKASSDKGDVGIYYDQDPDTRYQDALTAAQVRQAKVNKRANLQMPSGGVMKRPTPMGQLNLAPPGSKKQGGDGATEAARGGIMQAGSSLGGYAAGGNPRLLKGPGDGMSDNIPAMIGSKQPARLADGEFVIPADVVSHLGNGSTEAGAKRLHEMMTKVRKDRTGNPKQGKQINPRKYMPK